MSVYSAPERNTGAFISAYHPKKIFSTDHTHSGIGDGDVKQNANNDFTGSNSFSQTTTFTNGDPIVLETDGGVSLLKFQKNDQTAGSITFSTNSNINGDLIGAANKVILRKFNTSRLWINKEFDFSYNINPKKLGVTSFDIYTANNDTIYVFR